MTLVAGGAAPPCTQTIPSGQVASSICAPVPLGTLPGDGGPATGAALAALGGAVFVGTTPSYCQAGGAEPQAAGSACGVAVDPLGNLYIGDTAVNRIRAMVRAAVPAAPGGA